MARIDIKSSNTGGGGGGGNLQLLAGASMSATLTAVADTSNTTSPLKLSTTSVQVVSPLRITTSDASGFYLDAEDSATNNRFSIKRDPSSQLVTLDFASNPAGSTTSVGAIRTYVDGVNLSEAMTFREDGNVGIGTTSPTNSVSIERTTGNAVLSLQGNAGTFISISRFSNNSTRPRLELYKSRGTISTPAVIQTNDELGSVDFYGYDGSANQRVGILYVTAESVVGSTITPQMGFGLGTSAATTTYKMVIKNDGNVTIGNEFTSLGARLGIKGSGSTSATTSLLVQNSAGTQLINMTDDGRMTIGTNTSNSGALLFQYPQVGTNGVFWGDSYSAIWGSITLSRGSGEMRISANVGGYFQTFYTEGVERMRIDGAGIVAIGTAAPNASAKVQIDSTTQGFLPPRMTDAQRAAISSPAEGLLVYNTDNHAVAYRDGTNWGYLCGALQTVAGSGGTVNIPYGSGNIADITLTASTTFTFGGHVVGTYILKLTQGGSGSYTVTWPASVLWSGGTAPTLTTTVGKTDIVTLFHDGTNFYGTYSLNY